MFAEVAPVIPLSPAKSSAIYTYRVPPDAVKQIRVGSLVTIHLGRQTASGIVLRLHSNSVFYPTKFLVLQSGSPLTEQQLAFGQRLSEVFHGGIGFTLRLFFPPDLRAPMFSALAALPPLERVTPRPAIVIEKNDAHRFTAIRDFITAEKEMRQVLLLVPEVSQVRPLERFLGESLKFVSSYYSNLSVKQMSIVWQNIYKHKPAIIIGTQKALYLPWQCLSHVIIEEEYLDSHKLWDQYPRLDNRYAAAELAHLHRSHLLYSSSALSPALAFSLEQKVVQPLVFRPAAPPTKIIPVSFGDRRKGHLLPPAALAQIREGLKRKERVLLLHNQRAIWRAAICVQCNQVLRCPNCSGTVIVEGVGKKQLVHCRQCSFNAPRPVTCSQCGHTHQFVFNPGTDKIAAILHQIVPHARIIEITASQVALASSLQRADIVLSTTAVWRVAHELFFNRAIWLFPESTLLYPDYRSSERARAILIRLSKKIPPRRTVLVVTCYPDLIKQTLAVSPQQFAKQLLRERTRLHYPPAEDLIKLTMFSRSEPAVLAKGRQMREQLDAAAPASVTIRGPYQGFKKKETGRYAVHFLLAGPLEKLMPMYKNRFIDRVDLFPAQIL